MNAKMSKDEVFAVVKKQILEVLFELPPDAVDRSKSLKDLGANSIDRSEIAMASMEALGLNFPLRELAGIKNIEELVSTLHEKLGG
ncbi:MAG: phosphopantetheine-binding protein [Polyangiaceae bacterium]|nr:phosphopantetheine-binding protein [Polyangiaceae bacterium]